MTGPEIDPAPGRCVLVLTGYPGAGKTTLARELTVPVVHLDDHIGDLPWSDLPAHLLLVCHEQAARGDYAVEGCQALRVLRAGLVTELVLWLVNPDGVVRPNQRGLCRAMDTHWERWLASDAAREARTASATRGMARLILKGAGLVRETTEEAGGRLARAMAGLARRCGPLVLAEEGDVLRHVLPHGLATGRAEDDVCCEVCGQLVVDPDGPCRGFREAL